MTTQEPVPGLDELRAEYEKFLRTWFSTAAILRTEPPGMRDHQKEADRRFAALVTAIEAPWREALEELLDVNEAARWGKQSQEKHEGHARYHPPVASEHYFSGYMGAFQDVRRIIEARALLHPDAEVNDD